MTETVDARAVLECGLAEAFPELTSAARQELSATGVVTGADLLAMTAKELTAVRGIGRHTLSAIKRRARDLGVTLGAEPTAVPRRVVADAGEPGVTLGTEPTAVPRRVVADAREPDIKIEAESVSVKEEEEEEAGKEEAPAPEAVSDSKRAVKPPPQRHPCAKRGARAEKDVLLAAFGLAYEQKRWEEAARLQKLLGRLGMKVHFTKPHSILERKGPPHSASSSPPPEPAEGPRCTKCGSRCLAVGHTSRVGKFIIRYRKCQRCGKRVTTCERAVVKVKEACETPDGRP